jgi:hypothetical protein
MTFTPWRELLARADEALAKERKTQALAAPFALLESMMQLKVRQWAVLRRHRIKRRARSGGAFSVPMRAPAAECFL